MAAEKKVGTGTLFKFDTIDGAVYVSAAFQLDGSITLDMDAIESTTKDDSQRKTFLAGNRGWGFSMSGNIDSQTDGDTDGLVLITTSINTGVLMDFQLLESGTTDTFTGDVLITNVSKNYPQNGVQNFSVTGVGTGELSIA